MRKTVNIDIGINSAFMTRRYEEPASWAGIVDRLGFRYMSFDSDALDPFFSGPMDYILDKAREMRACAEQRGIKITDYLTGFASYRFMGLAHRDAAQRERMEEWFRGAIDIAAAMGAYSVGGRCDALSQEVLAYPRERLARCEGVEQAYRDLAEYAAAKGLSSISSEIMYVPSLVPHTFPECERFYRVTNTGKGVAVRPVVDTGHCCGQKYGVSGDELLYERWLERWGAACEIIHIQQTRRAHSDHAAFTAGNQGDIEIETILNCLRYSIEHAEEMPWSEYLQVPDRIMLVLEAIPSTTDTEEGIEDELAESFQYLSRFVPLGGINI